MSGYYNRRLPFTVFYLSLLHKQGDYLLLIHVPESYDFTMASEWNVVELKDPLALSVSPNGLSLAESVVCTTLVRRPWVLSPLSTRWSGGDHGLSKLYGGNERRQESVYGAFLSDKEPIFSV